MNRIIPTLTAAALSLIVLSACGSGQAGGEPTEESLSEYVDSQLSQVKEAVKQNDAGALVKATRYDSCPVSVPDAVMGLAMMESFGLSETVDEWEIESVRLTAPNKGQVIAQAFGESETSNYTFRDGLWREDAPAGGCEES